MTPDTVLHFWFTELTGKQRFAKDAAFSALIAQRFRATREAGARCELFGWRASPAGRLAEIIVLDQFSRNVWRDTPRANARRAGNMTVGRSRRSWHFCRSRGLRFEGVLLLIR